MELATVHALQPQSTGAHRVECHSSVYCCLCFEVNVGVPEEGLRVPTCAVSFVILDLTSVLL
jgi:hypothetical protein